MYYTYLLATSPQEWDWDIVLMFSSLPFLGKSFFPQKGEKNEKKKEKKKEIKPAASAVDSKWLNNDSL